MAYGSVHSSRFEGHERGAPPPGGYGLPGGHPDRTPPPELAELRRRIDRLQRIHLALFLTSLVLLVSSWVVTFPLVGHVAWAVTLGGAVVARVKRQSLVAKYNAIVTGGRPAPLV